MNVEMYKIYIQNHAVYEISRLWMSKQEPTIPPTFVNLSELLSEILSETYVTVENNVIAGIYISFFSNT